MLLVLLVCDLTLGTLLDYLRDHAPDGRYQKIKYSLDHCDEEIVLLGDSRGEIDLVPRIFEDSLGLSCWNASRGGQGLLYFRAVAESILDRYRPRLIVLNLSYKELQKTPQYDRLGILRPFYRSHAPVRCVVSGMSRFERYFHLSRLFEYNSSFYYLLRPYLIRGLDGKISDKGWKPKEGGGTHLKQQELQRISNLEPLDAEAVALFDDLIDLILSHNVEVHLLISPNHGETITESLTIDYLEKTSLENNIPLHIFARDTTIAQYAKYFYDHDHLNTEGAVLYSKKLVREVKSTLRSSIRRKQLISLPEVVGRCD